MRKVITFAILIIILIAVALIYYSTYKRQGIVEIRSLRPSLRVMITEINGTRIEYKEILFYNKNIFDYISRNWKSLREKFLKNFTSMLEGVSIGGKAIYLNSSSSSVVFKCTVYNRIWRSGDSIYADFLWLLNPLNLDFIDNKFNETNSSLSWSGNINSIPTKILVKLPPQKLVYKAWGEPVGHCHGHVWWKAP